MEVADENGSGRRLDEVLRNSGIGRELGSGELWKADQLSVNQING